MSFVWRWGDGCLVMRWSAVGVAVMRCLCELRTMFALGAKHVKSTAFEGQADQQGRNAASAGGFGYAHARAGYGRLASLRPR